MMTICVTGMGCVSPAGPSCSQMLANLDDDAPPALTAAAETGQTVFLASLMGKYDSRGERHRSVDFLMQAVDEALEDADLTPNDPLLKVGVCIGTTSASFLNDLQFHRELRENNILETPVARFLKGNPSEYVKKRLGFDGPAMTVTNACASGTDAIGIGASWIRNGVCDIVVAGGADEVHDVSNAGFYSLGVTSQGLCRPFDLNRDGLNLGEGAGVMILESVQSARRRGKTYDIAVKSYAAAGDALHITQPDPEGEGVERAIIQALKTAELAPGQIDFINAHGTGTIHNDLAEGKAFGRIFGSNCRYFSTKGKTGHTLGASGAIEAIITSLLLRAGMIPRSCRFETPDPEIPVSPVDEPLRLDSTYALSTSLAFGGCNSALILERLKNEVSQ